MIDRKWIGWELPPSVLPIERGRLKLFAKTVGETDPIYTDTTAARAAGYADIPAPPTFLVAAELDSGAAFRLVADLDIPLANLLHGEQKFIYHRPICVGDSVTVRSTISEIYDKKEGALDFVVKTSRAINQRDELVAELCAVLVCRNWLDTA